MSKQLKLRRGTTAQHSTFTGASGEVTVDTDKKTLVVHDGTTAGGNPVLSTTAGAVGTSNLASNAVTTVKIADYSVTTAKIAAGAVGATELASNAVTTAKIAAGAVGATELASNAVTTVKITDANITASKLSGAQSGSAPIYGARAWVNFNGTGTVAIRGSGNVSSITDLGTGYYQVNITTALSDANYATIVTASSQTAYLNDGSGAGCVVGGFTPTTSAVRVMTFAALNSPGSDLMSAFTNVAIFR